LLISYQSHFAPGVTSLGDEIRLCFTVPFSFPPRHPKRQQGRPAEIVQTEQLFSHIDEKENMHPARRQELKQLVEIYAIRTRQLSDTLSLLGGYVAAGRPISEIMNEIKRIRILAENAANELFAFVWPSAEEPPQNR
jgi:hypothetical protein